MARTPFEVRKAPGGVYALVDESRTTGNYYFVSSVVGLSTNSGLTPDSPLATIAQAVALCTSSNGDVIICMPGHTEVMIAAGTLTLNKTGVRIVGLGVGNDRPTITYSTSANASVLISNANCSFENFIFDLTGIDALANPINVNAADFALRFCRIRGANATNQATLGVNATTTCDRMTIDNCVFTGTADAGMTAAIQLVGGDGIRITNNQFIGAYTAGVGAINNITTAVTNCIVFNNLINNLTASSTKAMVFVAGSTGQIAENKIQILSGTAPITGAAMSWVGANYYAAAIATAGTLI